MTAQQQVSVQLQPDDLPTIYALVATHPKYVRRNLAFCCALVIIMIHSLFRGLALDGFVAAAIIGAGLGLAIYWLGGTGWYFANPNKTARERFREALLRPQVVVWDGQGISSKCPLGERRYRWPDLRSWRARSGYMLVYAKDGLLFPVTDDNETGPGTIDQLIKLFEANGVRGDRV
jgi:hypothetical protein